MKQLISPGENKVPAVEGKNVNKSKAEWHDMASSGRNVEATGTEIDTSLTRQFAECSRALLEKHGANSLVGRLCKTIASQLRKLPDHVTPAWATHPSQTLQGKIRWQLAQLEAALQGR